VVSVRRGGSVTGCRSAVAQLTAWWPITNVDFTPDDGAGVPAGLGVDISANSSGAAPPLWDRPGSAHASAALDAVS
jgi:hypothetical protein